MVGKSCIFLPKLGHFESEKGVWIIVLGQHTWTRTFPGELGDMVTQYLYATTSSSCFRIMSDSLPFFVLPLKERTICGFFLPFLCASCFLWLECSWSNSSFPSTIFKTHVEYPFFPKSVLVLSPWNFYNPLFVGCLSKFSDFCITFLWSFDSCPKWTMCSLVLGIMS